MPKCIYIQVHGAEKPLRLVADKIEHQMIDATGTGKGFIGLVISLGGRQIGEFKHDIVDGWWFEDEPSA